MRRALAAALTAAALGAGALTAAPASAGVCHSPGSCADPTPVSLGVSPRVVTVGPSGTQTTALTAVFDDPDDTMRGVAFTVDMPDGASRTVSATDLLSRAGIRKTYRTTYPAYSFYAPGTYRVKAVPTKAPKVAGLGNQPVSRTFKVRHKLTSTLYSPGNDLRRGDRVRFTGVVANTTDVGGLKVKLRFKAKGKKKFRTVRKPLVTKVDGTWRSKMIRMRKPGRWFAKVGGKRFVLGARSPVVRTKLG